MEPRDVERNGSRSSGCFRRCFFTHSPNLAIVTVVEDNDPCTRTLEVTRKAGSCSADDGDPFNSEELKTLRVNGQPSLK